MDATRWKKIQTIFHHALELEGTSRDAYLNEACRKDRKLLEEVYNLIQEDSKSDSFLDRGLGATSTDILHKTPAFPEKIGDFRLVQKLGEGGMGVVYLAHDDELNRPAAIKFLRDAWVSEKRRERFAYEQQMLARLTHPSIAQLYTANTLPDGTPYFVMEYIVDAKPLDQYCKENKCGLAEILRLFRQVCKAVQHAHHQAVIHLDLKPSNILVNKAGEIKLLDFGIAKQVASLEQSPEQTQTVLRMFTPAYASPEQRSGNQVGLYSDVYALGLILFELLTSEPASRVLSEKNDSTLTQKAVPSETVKQQVTRNPGYIPVLPANNRNWKDLDVLCMTASHLDPQRRYQSVDALIRDLDHYNENRPLEARPDSLRYKAGKFIRRNRTPVTATLFVLLLVVSLVTFYTRQVTAARDTALAESRRLQRVQQFMMDLFEGGDNMAAPPDSLTVLSLVDRGVTEADVLDGEPEIQAELYETLGGIFKLLGEYERADSLLRLSLKTRSNFFGKDHPLVGQSLVEMSVLRAWQYELEEAEKLARDGLTLSQKHLPPNHPQLAHAYNSLAFVLRYLGRYEEAVLYLEHALRIHASNESSELELLETLGELANVHYFLGNYTTSDSLHQITLEMDRRILGERHPHVAVDYFNLGIAQLEWESYDTALSYFQQAYEINEAHFGVDYKETANNMLYIGRALVRSNKLEEAKLWLDRTHDAYSKIFAPDELLFAVLESEYGKLAMESGDFANADAAFSRALVICRKWLRETHSFIAIALTNQAGPYLETGNYHMAEDTLRAALERFNAEGEPTPDPKILGLSHLELGRALLLQEKYVDAEIELKKGLEFILQQKRPSLKWQTRAYEDLIEVQEQLGDQEELDRFKILLGTAELQNSRI